jgi:threonine/homoserine/homoserine lactone efflux protein
MLSMIPGVSMFGIHDLPVFLAAGFLLNLTPGPDTGFVVGQAVRQGFRGGALAALGIGAGCFVHIGAAAVGLSALLLASSTAFAIVKWIGVLYLCYLGLRLLLAHEQSGAEADRPTKPQSRRAIFWQGFLTNALNPKVALFFLAFLPQFFDAASPDKTLAFIVLGMLFNLTGTAWLLLVAWGASRTTAKARSSARLRLWLDRTIGALFIGLGVRLALSGRS